MNQKSLTVSLIILTRDRPVLLRACLASVRRQTKLPNELIIVDGSQKQKKETRKVVDATAFPFPLIYIHGINTIPGARDAGAKRARGNIIVFLDDDLVASRDYIARSVRHFQTQPGLTATMGKITNGLPDNLYASTQYAYYDRGLRLFFNNPDTSQNITSGRMLDCEVMAIRRHTLLEFGFPVRKGVYRNDDVELGLRLVAAHKQLLYDPTIRAVAHPRTTLIPLFVATFWNGFSDAFAQHEYRVNIHAPPYPLPKFSWFVATIRAKTQYSLRERIMYGITLILFPLIDKVGEGYYWITRL